MLSRKLEYQELTPCLKEITTVWEEMLSTVQEDVHQAEEEDESREEGHKEVEEGEGDQEVEGEDRETLTPRVKVPPVSHETLLEYVKKGVYILDSISLFLKTRIVQ